VNASTAGRLRRRSWAIAAAAAALLALVLFGRPPESTRREEARLRQRVREVSAALASPDAEARMRCLWALCSSDLVAGDSIYANLGPVDRARARQVVLEALRSESYGRAWSAALAISGNIRTEMHDEADQVGVCLESEGDPGIRHRIATALASTGNTEAMRRHLSTALIAEPVRRNRLWYARLLWEHDLGPVEARLLTSRADGKVPSSDSAAIAELRKELANGGQEAADALCFSGHLDLLSAEQKADLAGRLGEGGHARIFPPTPEAERGAEWGD